MKKHPAIMLTTAQRASKIQPHCRLLSFTWALGAPTSRVKHFADVNADFCRFFGLFTPRATTRGKFHVFGRSKRLWRPFIIYEAAFSSRRQAAFLWRPTSSITRRVVANFNFCMNRISAPLAIGFLTVSPTIFEQCLA